MLSKFARLRIEGYRHLSRAVKEKNNEQFATYAELDAQATAIVQEAQRARAASEAEGGKPAKAKVPVAPAGPASRNPVSERR